MKRINYNILFVIVLCIILSFMVVPIIFKFVNRITPFVLGLPFVTFWVVFLCLCMSFTLIAWYYVDLKSGNLNIDIDEATEEELHSWKSVGER